MEWTDESIKSIIDYCKNNNVEHFAWSNTEGFEFKFFKKSYETDAPKESKLTLEEIEKKQQEDYHKLMFMSST